MKVGDKIEMSILNRNHTGYDVCAYAGYKGIVSQIWEDGGFAIDGSTSSLVVPANNAFKIRKRGVWVHINGELIYHKFAKIIKPKSKIVLFLNKLFN